MLELESKDKALVIPRVENTGSIKIPRPEMLVYDISQNCIVTFRTDSWGGCLQEAGNGIYTSTIIDLDCINAVFSPLIGASISPYSGTVTVSYSSATVVFIMEKA